MIEIKVPQLGRMMEEGTIVNYPVKVGDKIKKCDVLFELEVDKATIEVESPADGFVKFIRAEAGQSLAVGEIVMILAEKDEKVPQNIIDSLKAADGERHSKPAKPKTKPGRAVSVSKDGLQISRGNIIPLSRLQKITAKKMLQSKQEIPCFYLTVRTDVSNLVELRTKLNQTGDIKISYNDFIMRAIATSLEKFPVMAGRLEGDNIALAESINIGLAVFVAEGLIVPVIKDVQKKTVVQIAHESQTLIEKAHNNKLTPADLEGGCITVSNLGSYGVEFFIPIVVPGQCSILGIGQITDTCVPDNGNIAVHKLMSMTLSVDHRITNGAYASQFLDFVRKTLEDTSSF
jgi:pyruvate dehydrogenase E2 component (dihydrolipoamide acetyltransferase)